MILPWLVYTGAVGLLFAAAASLLERPLSERGVPVRWVWIASLAALFLLPAAALLKSYPAPAAPVYRFLPVQDLPADLPPPEGNRLSLTPGPAPGPSTGESRASLDLNRWIVAGWALASGALALLLTGSVAVLRHRQRRWRQIQIDGRHAWISPDTGPAVVGAFPGTLVIPEWLLRLPENERELILKHEEEHVRARDPLLLLCVLLLRIALPWNPALWWIGRSLRRAVEVDCDRRVLAGGADPRAYARVLLDVSERGTAHRLTVAALSESPSFLERRIRLMVAKPIPRRGPRTAGVVGLALAAAVAACQIDQPESQPIVATGFSLAPAEAELPTTEAEQSTAAIPAPQRLPALPRAELSDSIEAAFRSILASRHPEVVSGSVQGERVNLYVAIDGNGDVVDSAVDTEPRSGSCTRILEEGLGRKLDRESWGAGGCGGIDAGLAGPSRIAYFWSAAKPANEQERLAPTGPYLFDRLLQASRPTREQMVAAVRQYFPEIYEEGTPQGEGLWFVADRYHQVVHAGRAWEPASSAGATAVIQKEIPGINLDGVLMSGIRSARDTPISISWASLGDGSPSASVARPDPYPHAQTFAVSTLEPGREVEIRLEGEAASDPSSFRISGKFTNDDGVLTALTPFTFIVMTGAPYHATLRLLGDGEMQLETESQATRLRTTAGAIHISRSAEGEAPQILSGNMIAAQRPSVERLPVTDPVRR